MYSSPVASIYFMLITSKNEIVIEETCYSVL